VPAIWYSAANVGRYALVPPVLAGLVIPAGLLLVRTGVNPQLTPLYIDFSLTLMLPSLAAWWPPFVFRERIEGDGRELLYFLQRGDQGVTALALAVAYWVLLVPFLVAAGDGLGAFIPLLLARCLFLTSLAFCGAFVLRSSALALVLALLVNMLAMVPLESLTLASASALDTGGAGNTPVAALMLYAVLSVVLLGGGEIASRRFTG
jgi:hypothetical protein